MTVKIDSSEVLHHLNKYGIRSIDEDAFHQFMKDLKKLIRHEQRKKETSERVYSPSRTEKQSVAISERNGKGCNCDIQISSCCPENHATVTYVHSPCKNYDKLGTVCDRDAELSDEVPAKDPVRSTSSMSYTKTRHNNKGRRVNDPVQLYHFYQSIWKQHKLPGESDHAELRQAIRNRLKNLK